jgi:hypothetical protein
MRNSPFDALHEAMAAAVHCDMPDVEYEQRTWPSAVKNTEYLKKVVITKNLRRPYASELEIHMFVQTWSNTALGYDYPPGGIAGQAFTDAYTVIVTLGNTICVYFGDRGHLAYKVSIDKMSKTQFKYFATRLLNRNIPPMSEALNKLKGAIELKRHQMRIQVKGQDDVG